jgi:predicted metalloprotease with PDZ domain
MVKYIVKPHQLHAHLWEIEIHWHQEKCENLAFSLPNWVPGSYMIRDFSRHIINIEANNQQGALKLNQLQKNEWLVLDSSGDCTLRYWVYGFDLSVRGSYLDQYRGYFDGASLFMSCDAFAEESCQLTVQLSDELIAQEWQVASSMLMTRHNIAAGQYEYEAKSYAALIDHPFEMGKLQHFSFDVNGIVHRLVVSGQTGDWDAAKLLADVEKICAAQHHFFDGVVPFEEYVFLLYVGQDIYGGLEHRSSTALMADRRSLPTAKTMANDEDYVGLLGLFSHEYFHAWNVKSLKPAVFQPYNLQQEVYTTLLWFFEGVTSYYDDGFLLQAGVINQETYLKTLVKSITRVHQGSGRFRQSIAESSFNAWSKFYKQDENSSNAIVSYYQKGSLAALCLDATIRQRTGNQKSLDTVVQTLMAEYWKTGQGLLEDVWLAKAEAICDCDLADVYQAVVHGIDELPLVDALAHFGVALQFLPSLRSQMGDLVQTWPVSKSDVVDFGARTQKSDAGLLIQAVFDGGLASQAGLAANDTVVAINGFHHSQFDDELKRQSLGDTVSLHYFRQGVLQQTHMELTPSKNSAAYLMIENPSALACWWL